MRKLLLSLVFVALILMSCSNMNSKLEKSVSNEIGKSPFKNELTEFNDKTYVIIWDSVNISSHSKIKNTVDKTFGVLPYKHKESAHETSSNEYWLYENTLYQIELNYYYKNANPDKMMVRVLVTTK